MPITAAIIAGVALGGSTYLSSRSDAQNVSSANAMNVAMNREARDWTEAMSNTAHRREQRDLKAAGLNPILTATGGAGASSPNWSAAQVMAEPSTKFGDVGGAAVSGYQAAKANELLKAQIERAKYDAETAKNQAAMSKVDADYHPQNVEEDIRLKKSTGAEQNARTNKTQQEFLTDQMRPEMMRQELKNMVQQFNIGASAEARAQVEKEINEGTPGQIMIWYDRIRQLLPGGGFPYRR